MHLDVIWMNFYLMNIQLISSFLWLSVLMYGLERLQTLCHSSSYLEYTEMKPNSEKRRNTLLFLCLYSYISI